MTADEAATIRQLAAMTGRPARQIARQVTRTDQERLRFAVAVQLATAEWNWLDGETGQWSADGSRERQKLARYAASLFAAEAH